MRIERDGHGPVRQTGQFLLDFRGVAVRADAVSLEGVRDFAVERTELGGTARAGYAGLGVRDDAVGFDQAVGEGRGHAEDDRGGVAAGVRHKARLGNVGGVEFRQAVYRFGKQVGSLVLDFVPLLIGFRAFEAEVGGKIHHLEAALHKRRRHFGGCRVRDGEEGQIAFFGDEFRLGLDEDDVGSWQAIEERIQIAEPLARFGAGGGGGELHVRMAGQQARQLHSGVAGDPDKAHPDHFLWHGF